MNFKWLLLTGILTLSASLTYSQAPQFLTDWEEAQQLATQENKDLLIILTGSEWCAPCKKMDKKVIAHKAFEAYAEEHLIIFLVDLPNEIVYNSEVYQRYLQFQKDYQAKKLPSLILADSQGTKIKTLKGKMFDLDNVMKQLQSK